MVSVYLMTTLLTVSLIVFTLFHLYCYSQYSDEKREKSADWNRVVNILGLKCRKLRTFPGKFQNFGKSASVKDLTNIMSETSRT